MRILAVLLAVAVAAACSAGGIKELLNEDGSRLKVGGREVVVLEIRTSTKADGPVLVVVKGFFTDNLQEFVLAAASGDTLMQKILNNAAAGAFIGLGTGFGLANRPGDATNIGTSIVGRGCVGAGCASQ